MSSSNRVVAVIPTAAGWELSNNENDVRGSKESITNRGREVQVSGVAEVSCPADRASVRVNVSNSKESVNEVTNSISRRLEYILQALRQHGIKDEDNSVRRFLQRDADVYRMDAEVVATFSDFEKMEQIRSILLEKLDKSVTVGMPNFFHSPESLSQTRERACTLALENAQQKASKVSQLLGQSLGPPILVREDEARDWKNEEVEEAESTQQNTAPLPYVPHLPTITAFSRVSASFGFKERSRKKL